jgi:hypothetical protein
MNIFASLSNFLYDIYSFVSPFKSFELVRNVSLIEGLVVMDGFITALKFSFEYVYYKIQDNVFVTRQDYVSQNVVLKRRLIDNYNSLYKVDVLDRYLFYVCIYGLYVLVDISSNDFYGKNMFYYLCLTGTIPIFQTWCLNKYNMEKYYGEYKRNKYIFARYSVSKFIISSIQNLDASILHIQNYHIFILYKYLSLELVTNFTKSYIFIYVLYFLRDYESTYYYYKAIKLAYYYSTGYLFNAISHDDAVYIVNVVVKEKRWFDISKLEIVHAFYRVITDKYSSGGDFVLHWELYFVKFCTLWNAICLVKMFSVHVITSIFVIYLVSVEFINPLPDSISRIKRYMTSIIIYSMILLNTNDLITSAVFVLHPVLYYILEESVFFTMNLRDILKILQFYNKSDKNILKTKIKRMNNNEYVLITKTN